MVPSPPPGREAHVHLKPGRDKSVREGHPWIFSGSVARLEGPANAPVARVFDAGGRPLGFGFHSPHSQIRVRMLGAGSGDADQAFFAARIAEALELRRSVLTLETTGYRLLNAEGDGVPGWTVDRFGDVLVSQITAAGLEALRPEAYAALTAALPDCALIQSNDVPVRRSEGLTFAGDEVIAGEFSAGSAEARFTESGLTFTAELAGGQKTGFYCDQRENRRRAERLAGGRSVLDLFSHSGAFALYALRGGAERVVCVESSVRLLERGRHHLDLNGLAPDRVEWVKANVFEDLRERTETYGLVICDPPPLVRKRPDVDAAARAYKDLNRLALQRVAPGGFLLTFSCSGAVDTKLFRQIFFAAAVEAGVRVALLEPLAAAPDHPVAITHPQGEYLKGWLAMVRGPVV
ncbi:MAG TPA: class I SAM-dependent rRNA methyltransferase [Thermoanaerobaculia bacterium]|nr:class I SAM-dependent rRNA methyltransferase [Thermoanaerobaculia bacterium]